MNQPTGECKCTVDADGVCEPCKKILRESVAELADAQLGVMMAAGRIRKICTECHHKYADYAFAAMLPGLLNRMERETATQVVAQQLQFIQKAGFKSPLTRQVWVDHCATNGRADPLS